MRRLLALVVGVLIGQWLAFAGLSSPAELHNLGMMAWERHDFREAVRVWSHALALQPDNALFHCLRAAGLAHLGRREEAVEEYRMALLLDPPAQIARLAHDGLRALEPPRGEQGEAVVQLEAVMGVWIVPVMINGSRPVRFLLDTGSSVTLVAPPFAASIGLRPAGDRRPVALRTLGGDTSGPTAVVDSLRVGGAEVRGASVVLHDPGPGIDGILGNSFLSRYHVSVDPDRQLLHLRALVAHTAEIPK